MPIRIRSQITRAHAHAHAQHSRITITIFIQVVSNKKSRLSEGLGMHSELITHHTIDAASPLIAVSNISL